MENEGDMMRTVMTKSKKLQLVKGKKKKTNPNPNLKQNHTLTQKLFFFIGNDLNNKRNDKWIFILLFE